MANLFAIQSVGESLRLYLQASYPDVLRTLHPCTFRVISSGQLANFEDPSGSDVAVTLYLYRVTHSEHARMIRPGISPPDGVVSLELHWMVSVWSSSAMAEHAVFAWVLRQLHVMPLLDGALLTTQGGWGANEAVQLLPVELPIETLMRIWDALDPSYRISACYVARVVKVGDASADPPPVVATRMTLSGDGT